MSCQPVGRKAWTDLRVQRVTSKERGLFHFSSSLALFTKAQGPLAEEGASKSIRAEEMGVNHEITTNMDWTFICSA